MLKLNGTVNESKERIILTDTDVLAGVDVRASLSYDDIACNNRRTVSFLDTKALRFTVSAVLCRTHTFFVGKELQTDSQHTSIYLRYVIFLILRLR